MERLASKATFESDPKKLEMLRDWRKVDNKIVSFVNNSKPSTFEFLFESDGDRLWKHFVLQCERRFELFLDYLTDEQFNDMMANICFNETLYAY